MKQTARRLEITILSFKMPLPGQHCQQKRYKTLCSTQTGRDDFLFMSMICPLFSFLLSIVGSRTMFYFRSFQYLVFMAELVLCQVVASFFHSLPKQMLALDNIFMTVSSTAFIHMQRYNHHKMKVPCRGFKTGVNIPRILNSLMMWQTKGTLSNYSWNILTYQL